MSVSRRAVGILHRIRWAALVIVVSSVAGENAPTEAGARPNIIIILADDLGFSDVGCYGGEIRTPNIDSLASDGLRFSQFYNAAKCEPSRTSLVSGLYWQEAERGIKRGITIAQALHAVGYTTLACGKWHLDGNPVDRGFDHWFGFLHDRPDYFRGNNFFRVDHEPFTVPSSGFYTTDAFTEYAIRYLSDARRTSPNKPFFLYLAYNAPHDPLQAPAEDISRYNDSYAKGWDELRRERYSRQVALGVIKKEWQLSPRPEDIPAWDSLDTAHKQLEQRRMAVYAAMVDRMDQNIGRLLTRLKEWDIEKNTLVIFLSDNGANPYDRQRHPEIPPGGPGSRWMYGVGWANLSNTPFRLYKRNQHEGGIATPFIARWPAVIKNRGSITDVPAHVIDVMATCLELAGCDYHALFEGKPSPPSGAEGAKTQANGLSIPPLDGKSLVPILHGEAAIERNALFFQFHDHRAVRSGNWKLSSCEGKPWELYRVDTDRTEVQDLAGKEPVMLKQLEALYDQWWNRPAILDRATQHDPVPGYVDPLAGGKHRGKRSGNAKDADEDDD